MAHKETLAAVQHIRDEPGAELALVTLSAIPRSHIIGSGFAQVFAEIFWSEDDIHIDSDPDIRRIILGAPLFVRSSAPRPIENDGSPPPEFLRAPQFASLVEKEYFERKLGLDEGNWWQVLIKRLLKL